MKELLGEKVRRDHKTIESQLSALESALTVDISPSDRSIVLRWIVKTLQPALETHLKKEETALFPALEKLIGKDAGALILLKEQHTEVRSVLHHLDELMRDSGDDQWERITLASEGLIYLLEDHEQKEERLLIDVLQYSLKPKELKELSRAYEESTSEKEGDPKWAAPPIASRQRS